MLERAIRETFGPSGKGQVTVSSCDPVQQDGGFVVIVCKDGAAEEVAVWFYPSETRALPVNPDTEAVDEHAALTEDQKHLSGPLLEHAPLWYRLGNFMADHEVVHPVTATVDLASPILPYAPPPSREDMEEMEGKVKKSDAVLVKKNERIADLAAQVRKRDEELARLRAELEDALARGTSPPASATDRNKRKGINFESDNSQKAKC